MLDQLLHLIKEQGQETVVNNPEIPNEHNNDVMAEAGMALTGTMQNALANGQMDEVQQLFNNSSSEAVQANPLAQKAQSSFIDSITSKLGISKTTAMGIAASLIPMVLSKLVHRTSNNGPQGGGLNLPDLIGSLTGNGGNNGGGLGNILSQITSMNNGGGGFNLQEVVNQASGDNEPPAQQGSLQDAIKGFFR